MSLKAKLFSSIAAFALVACLLIVGVFAVSPANVNMGGNISFTASDVMATINGSVSGVSPAVTLDTITFDETDTEATKTWTEKDLTFASKTSQITFDITITNDSLERAFTVAFTGPDQADMTNVTVGEVQYVEAAAWGEGTGAQAWTDSVTIDAATGAEDKNSITIRVTFDITNEAESVAGAWDMSLVLTNVAA